MACSLNKLEIVHSGAVIEDHRASRSPKVGNDDDFLKSVKLQKMRDTQCHYQGRVHGQSGNSALSTCYGLVSTIFFIYLEISRLKLGTIVSYF